MPTTSVAPGQPVPIPFPTVTLKDFAAALIGILEGCYLRAYRDSSGVWTIGYGHTGPDVETGLTITREQANQLLFEDEEPIFSLVESKPILEAAALVSFGFNCGDEALKAVLAGKDEISNPVHCTDRHGNILPGLQSRRNLELMLIALSKQL